MSRKRYHEKFKIEAVKQVTKEHAGISRFDRFAGCSIFTRVVITAGCASLRSLVSAKMTSFLG